MIELETPRLLLRAAKVSDASFFLTLLNTSDWLQYIGDRFVKTLVDAERYVKVNIMAHYQVDGFGMLVVTEKTSGCAIGLAGLVKRSQSDTVELGYALMPDSYGKGYANEASKAIINWSFEILGFNKLKAVVNCHNSYSIKVLDQLGFQEDPTAANADKSAMIFILVR
jgi:RimJ/RimL family protein N-acetyltransferase